MTRIERRLVWSGGVRLSHLIVGLSVLVLMATGWLLEQAPSVAVLASDLHYLAASTLLFGVALRFWQMWRGGAADSLARWMPEDDEWPKVAQMLRFYLSLGKASLPRWYAHNPLWKPLYLLLYVCLLVLAVSGWLRADSPVFMGVYLPAIHGIFAGLVTAFTLLHALAVVLHDYRAKTNDVSAMIHGERDFLIEPTSPPPVSSRVEIAIADISKKPE